MAIIKAQALKRYLASVPAAVRGFLVYGSDPGAAHEAARLIVTETTGSHDDPMNVVHLTEDKLKDDPGLLADEAAAISMFGGIRAIWLRDPGSESLKCLTGFLKDRPGDARIVVEAGNLAKSSALRKLFEASDAAVAVPCYADEAGTLHDLIGAVLSGAGLSISNDARHRLASLLGGDRGVSRAEIEKLALYCYGNESVSLEDVEVICGNSAAESVDSLLDAAFEGNALEACRQYLAIIDSSGSTSSVLTLIGRHITFLEQMRLAADGGKSAEAAVQAARPPVFFKRRDSIARQVRLWTLPNLKRARKAVFETTVRCRELPDLDLEMTERCVMSFARTAQAARLGKS